MTQELGKRLADLRKRNGFSQDELAQKLKVSRQSICNWESGESSPSLDYMMDLAKLYKVSVDDLINIDKPIEDLYKEKVDIDIDDIKDKDKKKSGDKVTWNRNGIHIRDNDSGDSVHIDLHGIHVNDDKYDEDVKFVINEDEKKRKDKLVDNISSMLDGVMLLILIAAYLTLGFLSKDNWNLYWPLFFTFDIPSAFVRTFGKKDAVKFPIVWICLTIYCFLGTFSFGWHPYWVIFFAIPIYYLIANSISNIVKNSKKNKLVKDAKILEEDK